jgi:hypothetical protein
MLLDSPIRVLDGSRCSDDRGAHLGSLRTIWDDNDVQVQQEDLENTCTWRLSSQACPDPHYMI